jgi:hypothetical protein
VAVDPLSVTVEPTNAAATTPIVASFIRCGVSQVAWLFWSHARAPVAPAAAVIAHMTHTPITLALGRTTCAGSSPRLHGGAAARR